MHILILFFLNLLVITHLSGQQQKLYEHPIPYHPKSYACLFTEVSPIIDGNHNDECWKSAPWTDSFVDIEGINKPLPRFKTKVKMLWDENYFYIAANLEEPHLWSSITRRDAVMFHENNFEVFIDPDGDTHYYYEYEMNARNVFWDLFLMKPYRDIDAQVVFNDWNMLDLKHAVKLYGTLNNSSDIDSGWTIELAFPWTSISEMSPRKSRPRAGDIWRINFSRVEHQTEPIPGGYKKKKTPTGSRISEDNWVWSPQGRINMHEPESWGFVQFVMKKEDAQVDLYDESEKIKWALRQLYYQQRSAHQKYGKYQPISSLALPSVDIENYVFDPHIDISQFGYFMSAKGRLNRGYWVIRNDGRIWYTRRGRR